MKGATFVRLAELLVESVLLYGADMWQCVKGSSEKRADVAS